MAGSSNSIQKLFEEQVASLREDHFLVLYWAAQAEGKGCRYNLTNGFDDLKHAGITRTKQTAVAVVEALKVLRFIDIRDEGNRKNVYITIHGAKALEAMVLQSVFAPKKSVFLEGR